MAEAQERNDMSWMQLSDLLYACYEANDNDGDAPVHFILDNDFCLPDDGVDNDKRPMAPIRVEYGPDPDGVNRYEVILRVIDG